MHASRGVFDTLFAVPDLSYLLGLGDCRSISTDQISACGMASFLDSCSAASKQVIEVEIQECMFYLRRSKLIELPQTFKALIPASEFELNCFIRTQ